jgi:hypothetical protein
MTNRGSPAPKASTSIRHWINCFLELLAGLAGRFGPRTSEVVPASSAVCTCRNYSSLTLGAGACDTITDATKSTIDDDIALITDSGHFTDSKQHWEGHDHPAAGAGHCSGRRRRLANESFGALDRHGARRRHGTVHTGSSIHLAVADTRRRSVVLTR